MQKFYLNPDNTYWGVVVGSGEPPFAGAVEVPSAPDSHASQTWNGHAWSEYTMPVPLMSQLDALFVSMQEADQLQYLPFLGGIYALIDQGQAAQAKGLLAAIPTTGDAATVQQEMLAVLNAI